jgi:hypothetical protein
MKLKTLLAAVAASVFGLWGASASATITFTLGNNPQPGEENILFQTPETGGTITGATSTTNLPVQFTSLTGQTLFQNAQGQADIMNAADPNVALLNSIEVTMPGFTFGDFIMNPLNGTGTATVTVVDNFNSVFTYDLGNGQNFLTIVASADETIASVSVTMADPTTQGFLQFKQPRISGPFCDTTTEVCGGPGTFIPEPGSLMLLSISLLGLGLVARRRK